MLFPREEANGRAGRNCSRSYSAANENFMKSVAVASQRDGQPKPPGLLCIALMSVLDAPL